MATSPIYSWPEPDNTDLVKNGALAIRTLGDAIDTTMGTMVAKTIIDAKGDLIAGSAADTALRLAVGTNGQTLVADSTASTGLKWATASSGGMTLLSTTTLSGSSTTISSISTSYTNLVAVYYAVQTSSDDLELRLRVNSDTGGNYDSVGFGCVNTTFTTVLNNGATYWCVGKTSSDGGLAYQGNGTFTISNYSATTTRVLSAVNSMRKNSTSDMVGFSFSGQYRGSAAITSLTFLISTGTFSGGTILLYGVK